MEVHDNPRKAKSDPNTVLDIKFLEKFNNVKKMHEERIKITKGLEI